MTRSTVPESREPGSQKPGSRGRRLTDLLERPMSRGGAVVRLVAVTVLVSAALACLVLAEAWRAPVAERADTAEQLQEQAGRVVAEVFSADAATWEADRAHARSLVTATLASSVDTGLTAEPPAGVRAVRWEPVAVGVVDAREQSGTALVVAHVVVTRHDSAAEAQTKSVSADFVRADGRWLLSGLDELQ